MKAMVIPPLSCSIFDCFPSLFLLSYVQFVYPLSPGLKNKKAQIKCCTTSAWLLIRAFRFLTGSEQQSTQQIIQYVVKALLLRLKLHLFELFDTADSPLAEIDFEGTGEFTLFQVLQDVEELVEFIMLVHYCFHQPVPYVLWNECNGFSFSTGGMINDLYFFYMTVS